MKRSAKSIVQEKHHDARADRQMGNDRKAYWLIYLNRGQAYFVSGDTETKAWKKAAEKVAKGETK